MLWIVQYPRRRPEIQYTPRTADKDFGNLKTGPTYRLEVGSIPRNDCICLTYVCLSTTLISSPKSGPVVIAAEISGRPPSLQTWHWLHMTSLPVTLVCERPPSRQTWHWLHMASIPVTLVCERPPSLQTWHWLHTPLPATLVCEKRLSYLQYLMTSNLYQLQTESPFQEPYYLYWMSWRRHFSPETWRILVTL